MDPLEAEKRYLYIHTSGTDTPERTATPFYLATTAALMDYEVTMAFTIRGTGLLKKGVAESVHVKEGGSSLRAFIDQAKEAGVRFVVCVASLDLNDMTPADLIAEVDEVVGGAALNDLAGQADVVLTF